jgi:DNA (cytosine-5)-methyltransferase 1
LLRKSFSEYREYIELQLSHPDVPHRDSEDWYSHKDRLSRLRRQPLYHVKHFLLNSANYGLPQRRERVFIVAIRCDIGTMWRAPRETHSEDALLFEQWVSGQYWQEHRLTPPSMPQTLKARVGKLARLSRDEIPTQRWRTVRDALRGLPEPLGGREAIGFHNHVDNPGARSYHGHTGSPLDAPAKTLKAGDHGVPGGENMLVREDGTVRYFTIREAARLQGFPDEYLFRGAWTEAFRQLGNAVPVHLAQAVAEGVKRIIEVGLLHEEPMTNIQLRFPIDGKKETLATRSETRV